MIELKSSHAKVLYNVHSVPLKHYFKTPFILLCKWNTYWQFVVSLSDGTPENYRQRTRKGGGWSDTTLLKYGY